MNNFLSEMYCFESEDMHKSPVLCELLLEWMDVHFGVHKCLELGT